LKDDATARALEKFVFAEAITVIGRFSALSGLILLHFSNSFLILIILFYFYI